MLSAVAFKAWAMFVNWSKVLEERGKKPRYFTTLGAMV